jgi:hypothetical protein
MGGGVVQTLGHVVPPSDDAAAGHDDGADGDLPGGEGGVRFPQRLPHESLVLFHVTKIRKTADGARMGKKVLELAIIIFVSVYFVS